MADIETLLGVSSVYLFGRRLLDIEIKPQVYGAVPEVGANNFLRKQLVAPGACLARIFAFSFEGELLELDRPTIFLVHGQGEDPDDPPPTNVEGQVEYRRLARSPGSSSKSGLGIQSKSFAEGTRVWVYDKTDFSMRLDIETGTLEQILLGADAGFGFGDYANGGMARSSGGMARSSGAGARSSGGMARSSGGMARSSGWKPRGGSDLE